MVDIFLRKDNFADEPWYNEMLIFCAIGVCQPEEAHIAPLRDALAQLGYETHLSHHDNGKIFVVGGGENG